MNQLDKSLKLIDITPHIENFKTEANRYLIHERWFFFAHYLKIFQERLLFKHLSIYSMSIFRFQKMVQSMYFKKWKYHKQWVFATKTIMKLHLIQTLKEAKSLYSNERHYQSKEIWIFCVRKLINYYQTEDLGKCYKDLVFYRIKKTFFSRWIKTSRKLQITQRIKWVSYVERFQRKKLYQSLGVEMSRLKWNQMIDKLCSQNLLNSIKKLYSEAKIRSKWQTLLNHLSVNSIQTKLGRYISQRAKLIDLIHHYSRRCTHISLIHNYHRDVLWARMVDRYMTNMRSLFFHSARELLNEWCIERINKKQAKIVFSEWNSESKRKPYVEDILRESFNNAIGNYISKLSSDMNTAKKSQYKSFLDSRIANHSKENKTNIHDQKQLNEKKTNVHGQRQLKKTNKHDKEQIKEKEIFDHDQNIPLNNSETKTNQSKTSYTIQIDETFTNQFLNKMIYQIESSLSSVLKKEDVITDSLSNDILNTLPIDNSYSMVSHLNCSPLLSLNYTEHHHAKCLQKSPNNNDVNNQIRNDISDLVVDIFNNISLDNIITSLPSVKGNSNIFDFIRSSDSLIRPKHMQKNLNNSINISDDKADEILSNISLQSSLQILPRNNSNAVFNIVLLSLKQTNHQEEKHENFNSDIMNDISIDIVNHIKLNETEKNIKFINIDPVYILSAGNQVHKKECSSLSKEKYQSVDSIPNDLIQEITSKITFSNIFQDFLNSYSIFSLSFLSFLPNCSSKKDEISILEYEKSIPLESIPNDIGDEILNQISFVEQFDHLNKFSFGTISNLKYHENKNLIKEQSQPQNSPTHDEEHSLPLEIIPDDIANLIISQISFNGILNQIPSQLTQDISSLQYNIKIKSNQITDVIPEEEMSMPLNTIPNDLADSIIQKISLDVDQMTQPYSVQSLSFIKFNKKRNILAKKEIVEQNINEESSSIPLDLIPSDIADSITKAIIFDDVFNNLNTSQIKSISSVTFNQKKSLHSEKVQTVDNESLVLNSSKNQEKKNVEELSTNIIDNLGLSSSLSLCHYKIFTKDNSLLYFRSIIHAKQKSNSKVNIANMSAEEIADLSPEVLKNLTLSFLMEEDEESILDIPEEITNQIVSQIDFDIDHLNFISIPINPVKIFKQNIQQKEINNTGKRDNKEDDDSINYLFEEEESESEKANGNSQDSIEKEMKDNNDSINQMADLIVETVFKESNIDSEFQPKIASFQPLMIATYQEPLNKV